MVYNKAKVFRTQWKDYEQDHHIRKAEKIEIFGIQQQL